MPPRALFRQSDFLYNEIWTAEVDQYFIERLHEESIKGNYRVEGDNTLTIQVLQWIISNQFNREFTFEECLLKEQPFAYAYMTHGDPNWAELQTIFGGAALDDPFPNNVIYISSDEEQDFSHDNQAPVVDNQVIDVSSDDNSSSDSVFWREMMEEQVFGTPSDMSEDDRESIEIIFASPPSGATSPGSSNDGGGFIVASSSASNSPINYD
ncbi:hypothetical protein BUALT_Bualt09G0073900 [Buddleja alternifolia]|uniref:Uncharacterized protein n=1 Tax=Buddleja alternifolia TaxID=168488 RepID=A0AAV6XBI0_9LAMI|nr:hypothetical protein BUALT_Bualt09G0073900 [Buddleja alternifolia]